MTVSLSFAERLAAAQGATHALIDLDVFAANLTALRERLPAGAELLAVLKANAYGHGLIQCARVAVEAGAVRIGVARIEEALRLREAGITAPILVLGPPNLAMVRQAAEFGITLAVGSHEGLAAVIDALGDAPRLTVHLKIDTGMHRFGVEVAAAVGLAREILSEPRLFLEGAFTHFAAADAGDDQSLRLQATRFGEAMEAFAAAGITLPVTHMANSAAILRGVVAGPATGSQLLARAGLALYGLAPSACVPLPDDIRPVMTLKTRLGHIATVPAGEGISYGHTYVPDHPIRCATLPIGYGDGFSRGLSNRGWGLVRGTVCPIRGRVCMDQTVIEIEGVPEATIGDEVVLLGDGRDGAMTADLAAEMLGTINYEVVTALALRVPRIYLRGGEPVAIRDIFGLIEKTT